MRASHKTFRLVLAAAGFAFCCWAAWLSVRGGVSRLLSEAVPGLFHTEHESRAAGLASEAVALNPSDPEAHAALALALSRRGDSAAAVGELERAASLRPLYYLSWLRLARERERAGDTDGAIEANRESARLAPRYAAPRWQLGNTLLRAGRADEAFAELRAAAASRPSLLPYTLELAWRVYGEDARSVAGAVAPETPQARATLARFFARRGRGAEAVAQFRAGGHAAGGAEQRALVAELIDARLYAEAHEVWSAGEGGEAEEREGGAAAEAGKREGGGIVDGGFEGRASYVGGGFGWQFARDVAGVRASIDVTGPREGARSLLLEFGGESETNARLASQLVLVEPRGRYRLRFNARAEKFVSGGAPVVAVVGAGAEGRVLGESRPLPGDAAGWAEYELEFDAPEGAGAVVIVIRRRPCAGGSCPAFGRTWFDGFVLEKVQVSAR